MWKDMLKFFRALKKKDWQIIDGQVRDCLGYCPILSVAREIEGCKLGNHYWSQAAKLLNLPEKITHKLVDYADWFYYAHDDQLYRLLRKCCKVSPT